MKSKVYFGSTYVVCDMFLIPWQERQLKQYSEVTLSGGVFMWHKRFSDNVWSRIFDVYYYILSYIETFKCPLPHLCLLFWYFAGESCSLCIW